MSPVKTWLRWRRCVAHRLIRTFQADAEGKTTDDIIGNCSRMFREAAELRTQPWERMRATKPTLTERFDPKLLASLEGWTSKHGM